MAPRQEPGELTHRPVLALIVREEQAVAALVAVDEETQECNAEEAHLAHMGMRVRHMACHNSTIRTLRTLTISEMPMALNSMIMRPL
jgi:hypothetical protein